MRKIILIYLLIIVVFLSCSNKNNYSVKGSWMVIETDSTYNEVFYDDEKMHYYYGESLDFFADPLPYKIKKNTLIIYTNAFWY